MPFMVSTFILCIHPFLYKRSEIIKIFAFFVCVISFNQLVNIRAITSGKYTSFANFDELGSPVALQLAGCEPELFAESAALGEKWGFDEINVNLGCPSPRGVDGGFGARLMLEPELMARCVKAMCERVSCPVTVKCRLGVGNDYTLSRFIDFVGLLHEAGCNTFIIHARGGNIEWMNTKQNRSLLELRYGDDTFVPPGRRQFMEAILPYIAREMEKGVYLSHFTRHLLGVYHGCRRSRAWKQYLTENTADKRASLDTLRRAMELAEDVEQRG